MSVPAFCLQAHSQASKSVGSAQSGDEARSVGCLEEGAGISLTAGALLDGLPTRRGHAFNRPDLPHHLKECLHTPTHARTYSQCNGLSHLLLRFAPMSAWVRGRNLIDVGSGLGRGLEKRTAPL
jgi:hypothetical protein